MVDAGRESAHRWLTAEAAAARLGVNERTIRRAIARGELPATKAGRVFRIDPADVERLRSGASPHRRVGPTRARQAVDFSPEPGPLPVAPLPTPLTRFVGRERDVAAVAEVLRREGVRLVTLTGPGGVGKTRLALRAATEAADGFADGVAFVPLAPVRDPALVLPTIAQSLELDDGPADPGRRIVGFLRERRLLLVLDNAEHVPAAGPNIADFLVACPRLVVLVTSRTPLHLTGERVVPVAPLALPPLPSARPTAGDLGALAASDAVRLFLDRADIADPGFALTAANAADVASVCRQTDGLPLAIELAAARLRLLSVRELRERLAERLPLLADGPVDQPCRLRTLRGAIAWSYDLLDPARQALFRRLAVFVGGVPLGAVDAIAGRQGPIVTSRDDVARVPAPSRRLDPLSPLQLLEGLVDESLLQRGSGPDGDVRFGMLETVREFGLERLAEEGDEAAARQSHADWCLAFAQVAGPRLAGPDHVAWFRRIEAEIGNIRAAHAWLDAQGDAGPALRLGESLSWFWTAAGYIAEGRGLMERLVAMPDAATHPDAFARALGAAGALAHWLDDVEAAERHVTRALGLFRVLGDRAGEAGALRALGSIAIDRDEVEVARSVLEEAIALAEDGQAAWEAASAENLLGIVAFARGEYTAARAHSERAIDAWRAIDDTGHVGAGLCNLARAALADGDRRRANAALREVLAMLEADVGDDVLVAECFDIAAGLAMGRGSALEAAALLGAADAMLARIGVSRRPCFQRFSADVSRSAGDALGRSAFHAAQADGVARSLAAWLDAARAVTASAAANPAPLAAGPDALTPRECDVLRLLVAGCADKEIATALGIARTTASKHVASIRDKLGVSSRAAAVAFAIRAGLA